MLQARGPEPALPLRHWLRRAGRRAVLEEAGIRVRRALLNQQAVQRVPFQKIPRESKAKLEVLHGGAPRRLRGHAAHARNPKCARPVA